MVFDKLWWAERKDSKGREKLKAHYYPLLEAAKKEKDEKKHSKISSEYHEELKFIDDAKALRTVLVINRAKRLGIQLPKELEFGTEEAEENEDWIENRATGNLYLTDKAMHALLLQFRQEEKGRLEHKMRYSGSKGGPISIPDADPLAVEPERDAGGFDLRDFFSDVHSSSSVARLGSPAPPPPCSLGPAASDMRFLLCDRWCDLS